MDDLDNMIRKWERSFGSHKIIREVAPFFIESHWEEGVIPCAKHFPDCGTIVDSTDSHEKATRSILIEEFKETYKHVVANVDVPMVMTTHNIVIGDESELPATFSPYVLSILRNEIGFGECIITDDLTMGSIRGETLKATIDQGTEEVFLGHNGYSMRDILTRSLNAGHDLLLFKNLSQFKGCDSRENQELDVAIEENRQKCFPIIEGLPAITSAGSRRCMDLWRLAMEAYSVFDHSPTEEAFRDFVAAIPDPAEEFYNKTGVLERCGFQNVIIDAYMNQEIFSWSPQVFDLTVFIARLWHLGDGAFTTAMREDVVTLLEKNPTEFLEALNQEFDKIKDLQTFIGSTHKQIDRPIEERVVALKKRQEILKTVQSQKLIESRNALVAALEEEIQFYLQ
ncbi:Beta-hexosaminidase [Stylophora pistillata]|uniref:beta-N-acetylhexosaminidase n=1 Tax=Stylophora pistillata TaxID=50429 RepID=A0A2B4R2R8_STYPI|nr:Beta-hexosaminidase [Stylophora pistillata]